MTTSAFTRSLAPFFWMPSLLAFSLFCLPLLSCASSSEPSADDPSSTKASPPEPVEIDGLTWVTQGVWVALQPADQRFNDSNSVVFETSTGLVLVDTQSNSQTVHSTLDAIQKLSQVTEKPLKTLLNTHWHSDHTQGNSIVQESHPEIVILGYETLVKEIPERAGTYISETLATLETAIPNAKANLASGTSQDGTPLDQEAKERLRRAIEAAEQQQTDLQSARLVVPTRTFRDRFDLDDGIAVLPFRGHTQGDAVIYLAKQKVLITGDLLDDLPFAGHGYPRSWLKALRSLKELDVDFILPGHGPVFEGPEAMDRQLDLLTDAIAQTDRCHEQGLDLEACQATASLESHRARWVGDRDHSDPAGDREFDGFMRSLVESSWKEEPELR